MFPDSIEVTFFGNCDLIEDFYQYLLLPGLNLHILFVFIEKKFNLNQKIPLSWTETFDLKSN